MRQAGKSSPGGETSGPIDEPGQGAERLAGRDTRLLGRIADFLGVVDLIAVMMVIATVCTAIATWRTASIATSIYLASERPYMGVVSLKLSHDRPNEPRVIVEYKNFGSVAAEDVVMFRRVIVDGQMIKGQTQRKAAGIVSPGAPHFMFIHLPRASTDAIIAGRSTLRVEIGAIYQGVNRASLCYLERFAYEAEENVFEIDGGSPRCQRLIELEATADSVPAGRD